MKIDAIVIMPKSLCDSILAITILIIIHSKSTSNDEKNSKEQNYNLIYQTYYL